MNRTSSTEYGLAILRAWSDEKIPCSFTVSATGLGFSAVGLLNVKGQDITLDWDGGSATLEIAAAREISENQGLVEINMESGDKVIVCQTPFQKSKVLH